MEGLLLTDAEVATLLPSDLGHIADVLASSSNYKNERGARLASRGAVTTRDLAQMDCDWILMRPGDVSYYPSGILHQAWAGEEGSTHITLACGDMPWTLAERADRRPVDPCTRLLALLLVCSPLFPVALHKSTCAASSPWLAVRAASQLHELEVADSLSPRARGQRD